LPNSPEPPTKDLGSNSWRWCYLWLWLPVLLLIYPATHQYFNEQGKRWLYILLLSAAFSGALTPIARLLAVRLGLLDYPNERSSHAQPTALLGGLAIFVSFMVALLLNALVTTQFLLVVIAFCLMLIMGLLDDWREIPALYKLFIQIAACTLVAAAGIQIKIFPNAAWWGFGLNIFISFLWLLGITNAMNFFDGLDGLAAGLTMLTATVLGIVAYQNGQPFVGWTAAALAGGALGFLPYNFKARGRASIFMGDAGSTFCGFAVAVLAIWGDWSEESLVVSITAPLLIFAVFIFDMCYISVERIWQGKVESFREWLEFTGKDHLHHRLAAVLTSDKQSVVFIYFFHLSMSVSALLLRRAALFEAALLVAQAAIILFIVYILVRAGTKHLSLARRRF